MLRRQTTVKKLSRRVVKQNDCRGSHFEAKMTRVVDSCRCVIKFTAVHFVSLRLLGPFYTMLLYMRFDWKAIDLL